MSAPAALRVLCWDDPRCTAPLRAAAAAYRDIRPDVAVALAVRPLSAFNDQPVEVAAAACDLLVFDHPMVARAAERGALLPLEAVDPGVALPDAVGASQDSYGWDGRTWGVAVDTACHVAASRPDLLAEPVPATWDQVLELAERRPGSVALPLGPADAFCALMSLSAATSGAWCSRRGVELLVDLAARVDRRCLEQNPPRLLSAGWWAYVPLTFGYSARAGIAWHDAPLVDGLRAPVLGGAGLGISATTAAPEEALRFALWYAAPDVQRDVVLASGGQPAARRVWETADGFFAATRRSVESAFVRPRHPAWPTFQEQAAAALHAALVAGAPAAEVHAALTDLHSRLVPREMSDTAP
jgi:multiple sugar transport system substrate-binding protein